MIPLGIAASSYSNGVVGMQGYRSVAIKALGKKANVKLVNLKDRRFRKWQGQCEVEKALANQVFIIDIHSFGVSANNGDANISLHWLVFNLLERVFKYLKRRRNQYARRASDEKMFRRRIAIRPIQARNKFIITL